MISISKSLSDLDRLEELRRTLGKYYTLALRSAAEYAVDLEPRHTADFRAHLQMLEARADFAASDEEYAAIQASFRGELRTYRDFSVEHLGRMKAELAAATVSMQSFADDVSTSGSELELTMKQEIEHLEQAAALADVNEIRAGILHAAGSLTKGYEELLRSNHATIAQLQDELRLLHQEMNEERRSIYVDAASGAWIRQKLDERVERLLREGQPFWVLFVWAGLKHLERQYSRFAVEEVRKALVKRMEAALEGDAFVARWSEEVFGALIETEPLACQAICEEVQKKLSDPFSVQEDGTALAIHMVIRIAAVERPTVVDAAGFYLKLGQVTGALAEGHLVGA